MTGSLGHLSNIFCRPTSTNKYLRGGRMGSHRICTGHSNDITDWPTMTLLLLSSNTFAHPSCMNDKYSRSWRLFGRISVALLIKWYLNQMGSQNLPLSRHWRNHPFPGRRHHPRRTFPVRHRSRHLVTPPRESLMRVPPLLDPNQDLLLSNSLAPKLCGP